MPRKASEGECLPDGEDRTFELRIDGGECIEAGHAMPEAYRRMLIRQMSQHAHSEYVGMLPEAGWVTRAPSLQRKCVLLAKIQDEAGHAQYLYSAIETLGTSRARELARLHEGSAKYLNIFNYPALTWADVGAIAWLTDGAAIVNQVSLAEGSYGPYTRALLRICQEENFHHRQGFDLMRVLSAGTPRQRHMAQDALDRWWWPTLMVFGPADADSIHSANSMRWRIKMRSNDALRQQFIDQAVPEAMALGLSIPDPLLRFNEHTGHYETGPIDWTHFLETINGRGTCSRDRIRVRRQAHADGEWVREAAMAHAAKRRVATGEST